MTAYVILSTAAGVVGIAAAVVFFALWRVTSRRYGRYRRETGRQMAHILRHPGELPPVIRMRPTGRGAHVARPHEPLPAGETVVLPLQPAPPRRPGRVNGSL